MGISSKLLLDATGTPGSELDSIYSLNDRGRSSKGNPSVTLTQHVWDAAASGSTALLGEPHRKNSICIKDLKW